MATAMAMETSKVSVDMAINRDCDLFVCNQYFLSQLDDLMSRVILLYIYLICFITNYICMLLPSYYASEKPSVNIWENISSSSIPRTRHQIPVVYLSNQLFFPTSPVSESPDKNSGVLFTRDLPSSFSSNPIVL